MALSSLKCPECGGDKTTGIGGNKYVCQYCGATFVNASENITEQAPQHNTVNCQFCGGEILMGAQKCRHCGEWLNRPVAVAQPAPQPIYIQREQKQYVSQKSKVVAALLAFFLGGFGVHEFYLGKTGAGVAFLLIFCCTSWMIFPIFIILFITFIQAISYLCMSDEAFAEKYH